MSVESRASSRARRWQRRVRWIVVAGIVIGVAVFTHRYDFDSMPEDYHHLVNQGIRPGERVVLVRFSDDTVIGPESVLLYRPPGHDDHRCYGVAAGLPGEEVRLEPIDGATWCLHVGGRRELFRLPPGHRLEEGVIPPRHFLILNGDRDLGKGAVHPDSRVLGLIPFDRVEAKVFPLRFD